MTGYTQGDLKNEWEFKIVRSDIGAFRKPEVLNKLLEEEAQAGWVMLEKFDDGRVRFKRPRSARARDAFLPDGVDPYRTQYGTYAARRAVVIGVMIALLLTLGLGVGGFFAAGDIGSPTGPTAITVAALIPLILVVIGFLLVVWKLRRLR